MNSPYPRECGSIISFIRMRRCGEGMASKAARREPTPRGYHTGTRVDAGGTIPRQCVLFEKMQGLSGNSCVTRCQHAELAATEIRRGARSKKRSGCRCRAEKPRTCNQ